MVQGIISKVKGIQRDFLLFLLVGVFLGIAQSIDGSTLSNFLKEKFQIDILQRSILEFPRELPGFLVFLVIGFLYALGDIRIAMVANILAATGMLLLGLVPANYEGILFFLFIYSMGQHIYMPLANSIGMSFANDANLGKKLGQLNAVNNLALVVSSAALWFLFRFVHIDYSVSFSIGAAAFLIAAVFLMMMNPRQTAKLESRFIYRKEYRLFYWLSILFGARKQIFLTFGPWVLVDVFKQKVTTMTILFFIISIIGIFLKPFIGYLIDRIGEKTVLGAEASVLILLCMGYAFAEDLFSPEWALIAVCICYVLDQSLAAVSMARATYLRKIAIAKEDVSPTLSMGLSIDHIVSMTLPFLGGYLWYINGAHGYKYVFMGGSFIAVLNLISVRFIKIKPQGQDSPEGQQTV